MNLKKQSKDLSQIFNIEDYKENIEKKVDKIQPGNEFDLLDDSDDLEDKQLQVVDSNLPQNISDFETVIDRNKLLSDFNFSIRTIKHTINNTNKILNKLSDDSDEDGVESVTEMNGQKLLAIAHLVNSIMNGPQTLLNVYEKVAKIEESLVKTHINKKAKINIDEKSVSTHIHNHSHSDQNLIVASNEELMQVVENIINPLKNK